MWGQIALSKNWFIWCRGGRGVEIFWKSALSLINYFSSFHVSSFSRSFVFLLFFLRILMELQSTPHLGAKHLAAFTPSLMRSQTSSSMLALSNTHALLIYLFILQECDTNQPWTFLLFCREGKWKVVAKFDHWNTYSADFEVKKYGMHLYLCKYLWLGLLIPVHLVTPLEKKSSRKSNHLLALILTSHNFSYKFLCKAKYLYFQESVCWNSILSAIFIDSSATSVQCYAKTEKGPL